MDVHVTWKVMVCTKNSAPPVTAVLFKATNPHENLPSEIFSASLDMTGPISVVTAS